MNLLRCKYTYLCACLSVFIIVKWKSFIRTFFLLNENFSSEKWNYKVNILKYKVYLILKIFENLIFLKIHYTLWIFFRSISQNKSTTQMKLNQITFSSWKTTISQLHHLKEIMLRIISNTKITDYFNLENCYYFLRY